jgi:hypothetical protein
MIDQVANLKADLSTLLDLEASFFVIGSELATAGPGVATRGANAALDRVWPIVVSRWSSSTLVGRHRWSSELFCSKL